ncbi:hypothetical protein O6H91_09G090800 [Diphasiastrum complanatum]|uniref:Uncharacterized protein n=1 Tax=Diphasiastrum complanatum TaxID=34168 RepID=A0ACC2CRM1_DIPCM|nr:hypothetical protein O6H91_09G090800 [Diphasiastrum complanatum]
MSGAQGAQPPGSRTATTYEMKKDATHEKLKEVVSAAQDSPSVPVDMKADKVKDASGKGGPVFGNPNQNADLGVTGSGGGGA